MFKKPLVAALIGAALIGLAPLAQAQDKVLRIVPQSDLKILDPIWTTAFITRNHGYAVYDTLFGVDAQGKVQPQMVGAYNRSADGNTWTFTLRDGLAFHDGKPVTSADAIQSIKRWGQRDGLGQKMLAALASMEAKDDKTFVMTFKEPFGMVLEALSKPSSNPPFIMPKAVAETPADQQINSTVGSGPYIFKADEYRPGEKIVYVKNTRYVPRKEAASGTAGGKLVHVDRMEWVVLNDAQTQANALANGEVDMIEWVPSEQYLALKDDPKIELASPVPTGSYALHLNRLVPPFNNAKIAQAALMAMNQEALLRAQMVHKELYNTNPSIYPSGSIYHSAKTSYFTGKPQFEKAKALLKEAGYKNEPIVLLYPANFPAINKFPPVMAALLKQAGFNVDMQSMDWPTLVTRRAVKKPASEGGWNAFITGWGLADNINPMYFAPMTGNGEKGWFGWTTDDELENLKGEFLKTSDEAQRKALATKIQERVFDAAVFAPVGEYKPLTAYRKGVVSGLVSGPVGVLWGIRKN
ncbi:ABC transporter substrate-binding protein [Variovorax saccharolyticus]|uniref:ABC transporter substrate-binding protein n=1 Tax=Variovorax saccharolyticus TaxID=3053516 RepID=UPI0025769C06|nr:ABC transporter substrate-binding protein [Variovorax sp. J31P216]MDM0025336.1 ABC transporter substrate-binding protein [Variovorax sp. J31P216]